MKKTKELSIFIDGSGDFGEYGPKFPYCIIGMAVHDQGEDISRTTEDICVPGLES